MSDEFELGDFEESDLPQVMELYDDYISTYEYFEELYFDALDYLDSSGITINEYDEIDEALKVGQAALRFGGELETMKPTSQFLIDREELSDQVRVLLTLKHQFDNNPGSIDFNPDKYDYLNKRNF